MVLLEVIKNITEKKKAANVEPTHVLVLKDLGQVVKGEALERDLKKLEAKGVIKIGNTINDRYIILL